MEKYKDKDWLYNEYVVNKRNMTDIGRDFGVWGYQIGGYLDKFEIPKRSLSETFFLDRKNPPVKVTQEAREFIIGNVLGDGGIFTPNDVRKVNKRTASYAHSSKYRDMLIYMSNQMKNFGFDQMGKIGKYTHKKNHAIYYCYWTKHYEELLNFRRCLYKDGKKIIPRDIEFTPTVCLHWYLGDGSLHQKCKYVRISTDGFPPEDVKFAVNKFNQMKLYTTRRPCDNSIGFVKGSSKNFLDYIGGCPKEIEHIYGYKFNY